MDHLPTCMLSIRIFLTKSRGKPERLGHLHATQCSQNVETKALPADDVEPNSSFFFKDDVETVPKEQLSCDPQAAEAHPSPLRPAHLKVFSQSPLEINVYCVLGEVKIDPLPQVPRKFTDHDGLYRQRGCHHLNTTLLLREASLHSRCNHTRRSSQNSSYSPPEIHIYGLLTKVKVEWLSLQPLPKYLVRGGNCTVNLRDRWSNLNTALLLRNASTVLPPFTAHTNESDE